MQALMPYRHHSLFDRSLRPWSTFDRSNFMPTDIAKTDEGLDFTVSLPGYDKDNVELELKDGYLTITATTSTSTEDKDENGHYLRRERFTGTCRRAFYVGDEINEDTVSASFNDGVLSVTVPFVKEEEKAEERKLIEIS